MSMHESENNPFAVDIEHKQAMIVAQLVKVLPNMSSIEKLLQWLAYVIVESFDLQLAQFWMSFVDVNDIVLTRPSAMVARNPSLPEQLILDSSMLLAAKRFAHEQRMISSQVVDVVFPPTQTVLLKQYGLKFCTGGLISSDIVPPLVSNQFPQARRAATFSLLMLFFLSQRAHRDMMSIITGILKDAVELAASRNLLVSSPLIFVEPPVQSASHVSPLTTLVPYRKEGDHLMLSENPFARTSFLPDKQALRVYMVIDGKKNVGRLCQSTTMDIEHISAALRTLLKLHRIELRDAQGHTVDATQIFSDNDL